MKRISLIVLLLIACRFTYSQGSWTQKTDFPGSGPGGAVGFSINGKGYVGIESSVGNFWEYDPTTDVWIQKADMPEEVGYAVGFGIGDKGYIASGMYSSYHLSRHFWEYDPALNAWTEKNNFQGINRQEAFAFMVNGKGYIGGGTTSSYTKKDFWEYDPATDAWTQKADYSVPVVGAVAFSVGDKGYVGTGLELSGGYSNNLWEYDPGINLWTQKADLPATGRGGGNGFSIGAFGYIGLGVASDTTAKYFDDFWQYNPGTDSWIQMPNFPGGAAATLSAFSTGSRGYICFGGSSVKELWEFTPDCPIPTGVTTTNIKSNAAKVNWNVVSTAQTYSVRYRKTGAAPWTKVTAQFNYKKLSGLLSNTQYDWSVKSVCDPATNASSDWSATQNFTTTPLKLVENDDDEISVSIFPNPASTTITLSLPSNQNTILSIFNLLGEKVKEEKVTGKQVTIDVSSLPEGLYLVREENKIMGKFMKE